MTQRTIFAASPTRTGTPGEALEGGRSTEQARRSLGNFRDMSARPSRSGVRRLRKRHNGRTYQLVAKCFVHGMAGPVLFDASTVDPSIVSLIHRAYHPVLRTISKRRDLETWPAGNDIKNDPSMNTRCGE